MSLVWHMNKKHIQEDLSAWIVALVQTILDYHGEISPEVLVVCA